MTKTRLDNDVTGRTNVVYIKNETELSWSIKSGAVYIENDIELSWPIRLGVICDENQIGQ